MALEISHLVVNGCSFTYCQGLYDPPNEGWPRLLANKLGVPVVNLGVPGSANEGVHRRTYEYFYKNLPKNSKPFYVIAMTMNTRIEAYVNEFEKETVNNFLTLSAIDNLELSKEIYLHMNERGICLSQIKKLRYWASLINLFEATKTPFVISDYMVDPSEEVAEFVKKEHPELDYFIRTHPNTLKDFNSITRGYPKALDGGHDGVEAQVVLANYIYEQIIRRYGEIVPVKTDYLMLKDFPTQIPRLFNQRNQWHLQELGKPYHYGLN